MDVIDSMQRLSDTMKSLNGKLECLNPQSMLKMCGKRTPLHGRELIGSLKSLALKKHIFHLSNFSPSHTLSQFMEATAWPCSSFRTQAER